MPIHRPSVVSWLCLCLIVATIDAACPTDCEASERVYLEVSIGDSPLSIVTRPRWYDWSAEPYLPDGPGAQAAQYAFCSNVHPGSTLQMRVLETEGTLPSTYHVWAVHQDAPATCPHDLRLEGDFPPTSTFILAHLNSETVFDVTLPAGSGPAQPVYIGIGKGRGDGDGFVYMDEQWWGSLWDLTIDAVHCDDHHCGSLCSSETQGCLGGRVCDQATGQCGSGGGAGGGDEPNTTLYIAAGAGVTVVVVASAFTIVVCKAANASASGDNSGGVPARAMTKKTSGVSSGRRIDNDDDDAMYAKRQFYDPSAAAPSYSAYQSQQAKIVVEPAAAASPAYAYQPEDIDF